MCDDTNEKLVSRFTHELLRLRVEFHNFPNFPPLGNLKFRVSQFFELPPSFLSGIRNICARFKFDDAPRLSLLISFERFHRPIRESRYLLHFCLPSWPRRFNLYLLSVSYVFCSLSTLFIRLFSSPSLCPESRQIPLFTDNRGGTGGTFLCIGTAEISLPTKRCTRREEAREREREKVTEVDSRNCPFLLCSLGKIFLRFQRVVSSPLNSKLVPRV